MMAKWGGAADAMWWGSAAGRFDDGGRERRTSICRRYETLYPSSFCSSAPKWPHCRQTWLIFSASLRWMVHWPRRYKASRSSKPYETMS